MGLFGFLKKKDSGASSPKSADLSSLNTDLPSLDGSNLNLDDNNLRELTLPSLDEPSPEPLKSVQPVEDNLLSPNNSSNASPQTEGQAGGYHDRALHAIPEDLSTEINQLFLSDPEWKEPDWENYEPYTEERIEPPKMEDFGITPPKPVDTVGITESINESANLSESNKDDSEKSFDIPEFDDVELKEHHLPDNVPYDVFVKGSDYSRVFVEMEDVKKMLSTQDEKLSKVLDTFKQEDLSINSCRDNMESIYKKMLMIDKKVFA